MDYFAETETAMRADRQVLLIFDGDTDPNRSLDIKNRLKAGLKTRPTL